MVKKEEQIKLLTNKMHKVVEENSLLRDYLIQFEGYIIDDEWEMGQDFEYESGEILTTLSKLHNQVCDFFTELSPKSKLQLISDEMEEDKEEWERKKKHRLMLSE